MEIFQNDGRVINIHHKKAIDHYQYQQVNKYPLIYSKSIFYFPHTK